MILPERFFVTGTGTDVGKTMVCGMLLTGLKGSYWKPIQCGYPSDREFLQEVTRLPSSHFLPEQYVFEQPLSPHLASRLSGEHINLKTFALPPYLGPHLIVEGAGGVFVPINEDLMIVDLIEYLKLPVLVVALSTLGTINHTLLTLQALRDRHLPILGVVLNGPTNTANKEAIEHYGKVSVIGQCPRLPELSFTSLSDAFLQNFAGKQEALR